MDEAEVQESVRGRVVDAATNEPLPGVNVIIEGTSIGTSTNIDGYYELQVPSLEETLVFTYVGYQRLVLPIEGRSEIDAELMMEAISGDELVVVGYGVQRRSDLTGSVASVSAEQIQNHSITNIEQALSGKVAGVEIGRASCRERRESAVEKE